MEFSLMCCRGRGLPFNSALYFQQFRTLIAVYYSTIPCCKQYCTYIQIFTYFICSERESMLEFCITKINLWTAVQKCSESSHSNNTQKKENLMFIYIFNTQHSSLICTFNLQVDMHISREYIQIVFIKDSLLPQYCGTD